MNVKMALPKGHLLGGTVGLLERAAWGLTDYYEGMRVYRLSSGRFPHLFAKVFHEEDIPVQVAIGNYDLGITSLDWIEELLTKYPDSALVKVKDLGYGDGALYAATSREVGITSLGDLSQRHDTVRIASEYPNLAEHLAASLRLRRFRIYPLWGAPEAYPPEHAELVLLSGKSEEEILQSGLLPLGKIIEGRAVLIANRNSWETGDMGEMIASICDHLAPDAGEKEMKPASPPVFAAGRSWGKVPDHVVRLALPDGHQQVHVRRILDAAGVKISDYPGEAWHRRPVSSLEGVMIKVIRPQDMLVQVANGNFDLAITGRDWLFDHLYQFPGSPVKELLDLKYGRVRLVAVVHNDLPVADIDGLRQDYRGRQQKIRVASEYVNIADRYARDNRLGMYRIIPTWGATEAFLPEDADLLIENTETGKTIARNNLKIIDTLFESTACLIGNTGEITNPVKREKIDTIVAMLVRAMEAISRDDH
ncbi:MAG: ATP phosphoribosyltransferase [Chloroflexota bacterium]